MGDMARDGETETATMRWEQDALQVRFVSMMLPNALDAELLAREAERLAQRHGRQVVTPRDVHAARWLCDVRRDLGDDWAHKVEGYAARLVELLRLMEPRELGGPAADSRTELLRATLSVVLEEIQQDILRLGGAGRDATPRAPNMDV